MINKMELMAPCHFGLEAVLKREILDLGYEISCVEDGRVSFGGGMRRRLLWKMCSCALRSVFF